MNGKRLIEITLALVLWYFLAGLVFERVLAVLPPGYDREAFFLAGAALPWSVLLLGFLEPPHSALGGVVQQALFLVLTGFAIALNAWLVDQVVVQTWRLVRIRTAAGRRRDAPKRTTPLPPGGAPPERSVPSPPPGRGLPRAPAPSSPASPRRMPQDTMRPRASIQDLSADDRARQTREWGDHAALSRPPTRDQT